MLNDSGDLAIAELAFWVPAFLLSVFLCTRQGGRSAWLCIALLGLARIIGAGSLIAYESGKQDQSLLTCAAITGSLGISFMLSALVAVQARAFQHMTRKPAIAHAIRLFYLVVTIGIILSIIAGVRISKAKDPQSVQDGYKLLKAASVLYAVVWVAVLGLLAYTFTRLSDLLFNEKNLIRAAVLCMPFALIRLVYVIIAAFHPDSTFNLFAPNVWAQAFMQVIEEFIFAIIFIVAGFIVTFHVDRRDAKELPMAEA